MLSAAVVAGFLIAGVPSARADGLWVPTQGERWQYQLQGNVDTNLCAVPFTGGICVRPDVYDIDLYANNGTTLNTAAVSAIHAVGGHAVCYVDAGTWENWRPDASEYPSDVLGNKNGWPGERWVDIRQTSVLLPIMEQRVAKCVSAGFDAVEFDNVDGYTNDTGFPLTFAEQITFNTDLADIAHSDGLSVGLKNDIGQLAQLEGLFDFAINEQCEQYRECSSYDSWIAAGKEVLEVEYKVQPSKFCPAAASGGRDAIYKSLALKAQPWRPCS